MNLFATIDLYAGGPGSGCVGPNCGRPKLLYYGTSAELAKKILKEGIHTSEKKYPVFTSASKEQAVMFGVLQANKSSMEMPYPKEEAKKDKYLKEHNRELDNLKVVVFTIDPSNLKTEPFGEQNPFIKFPEAQKDYHLVPSGLIPPSSIVKAEVYAGKDLFKYMKKARGYGNDLTPMNRIALDKVKSKTIKAAGKYFYVAIPVVES